MALNSADFVRIERAIRFLDEHVEDQPDLRRVAAEVGLSEYHFQRLFRRWAGVSPKRFLQFATANKAASRLELGASTLEASYAAGLSSPSRLHDLTVAVNAVTPGELKSGGEGLLIRWGVGPTPFGDCLVGATSRGICEMAFVGPGGADELVAAMRATWPAATIRHDAEASIATLERVFGGSYDPAAPLSVLLKGTNFQVQVWRALLEIPPAKVTTYGTVAGAIGMPKAARAVGAAIGANRIAFLIPCHRVIRATAAFGDYRWGAPRKRAILAWERGLAELDDEPEAA